MLRARHGGFSKVAGYEANGGFLLATPVERHGNVLDALPTRDAVLVQLAILHRSVEEQRAISALCAALPARYTASGRLQDFPSETSRDRLASLSCDDPAASCAAAEAALGHLFGPVQSVDTTDGVRVTFTSGEVAHLRPSGNAPELRCYTEADSKVRASEMVGACLELMERWR